MEEEGADERMGGERRERKEERMERVEKRGRSVKDRWQGTRAETNPLSVADFSRASRAALEAIRNPSMTLFGQ